MNTEAVPSCGKGGAALVRQFDAYLWRTNYVHNFEELNN